MKRKSRLILRIYLMNLGIKMKDFSIFYELPLTSVGAKVRIKERDTFTNYGMFVAPTKTQINIKHYIEWQIGYDEDFLSEIVVREKQRAVGVMAMLYFCFPVSLLKSANKEQDFLNRYINSKEKGYLQIDKSNIGIFLTILQIFGILSQSHKHDVLEILKFIINKEQK